VAARRRRARRPGGPLAARIVDQINIWDQDRAADPHLVAYPTGAPTPANPEGKLIAKPNIQLFLQYPTH
jgi:protein-L-isoaspartate(D-aspartate) O-methyltransferase